MPCPGCDNPVVVGSVGFDGFGRRWHGACLDAADARDAELRAIDALVDHPDDCECDECRTRFDAIVWGWLTPAHVAVAEREARTGEIPAA